MANANGGAGFAGDGRSPKGAASNGGAGFAGDGRSPKGAADGGGAGFAGDGRSPKGAADGGGAGFAGDGRSPKGAADGAGAEGMSAPPESFVRRTIRPLAAYGPPRDPAAVPLHLNESPSDVPEDLKRALVERLFRSD